MAFPDWFWSLKEQLCDCLVVSFQQVVHPIRAEEAGVVRLQSSREDRMHSHENARATEPESRRSPPTSMPHLKCESTENHFQWWKPWQPEDG
jgi:hypothetical protein